MSDGQSSSSRSTRWAWLGIISRAPAGADLVLDEAQAHVFRFLWAFLPEPSIARDLRFQHLLASRFLSDAGQQSLAFGALIAVARDGGSALEIALVGVAALIPSALFGLYGGAVADELPKRVALAGVYGGQAMMCFLVPPLLGTGLPVVLVLIFAVNTLGQVSGPTESSVLPLVASEKQLASAAAMIKLASSAGTGIGMALLAPVLVRSSGIEPVFYLAGVLLLLAASRVFDLPAGDKPWKARLALPEVRVRPALIWLVRHPAVATMIIVAVLAGTVNIVLVTLAPRYVVSVLDADAADTAYVFAPAAFGVVVALVTAPSIMMLRGERVAALAGLAVGTAGLFSLGLVGDATSVLDPVNPLRLLELTGINLGERLRTASLLVVPLSFGVALATTSVQTYVNRRAPLRYQGRIFAVESSLRNGSAIVPLLALGAAASQFGADKVLLASPFLLLVVGFALVQMSFRFAERAPPSYLEALESFWEEAEPKQEEM
ncbi:MAG: MFS transporter [Nitrospirota bacterium]|nr:MFS transporter [Nitrospirota bacterium]